MENIIELHQLVIAKIFEFRNVGNKFLKGSTIVLYEKKR